VNNSLRKKSCLFFGSDNCNHTNQCIDVLRKYEMDMSIILGNKRGEEIPEEALKWRGDFIFSYKNYWLLPDSILESAEVMALNFHPGTPQFPGSGSYSWALYENARSFGITVHLMNQKFDNGKILDVYSFPVEEGEIIENLIDKTSKFSVVTFQDFLKKLSNMTTNQMQKMINEHSNFNWESQARTIKDLDKMRKLDIHLNSEELSRRIRAFHFEKFPVFIEHKGFRFRYDGEI